MTKPREGVSLRGVRPALRISLATLVARLLLERAASLLFLHGLRQQGSRNAPTSTSLKLLTVCRMRQALQFQPLRSPPSGSSLNHRRMNGGIHISKKRITTIYPRDRKALSALSRCGYVSREQSPFSLRRALEAVGRGRAWDCPHPPGSRHRAR